MNSQKSSGELRFRVRERANFSELSSVKYAKYSICSVSEPAHSHKNTQKPIHKRTAKRDKEVYVNSSPMKHEKNDNTDSQSLSFNSVAFICRDFPLIGMNMLGQCWLCVMPCSFVITLECTMGSPIILFLNFSFQSYCIQFRLPFITSLIFFFWKSK